MKTLASLLLAVIGLLTMMSDPSAARAGGLLTALDNQLQASLLSLDSRNGPDDDRRRRRDEDRSSHPEPKRPSDGRDDKGSDRGENRHDNRINVAISIAKGRGTVLDAGQENGSIFWVRVATDHGRVDLLIDTDSGRIIGER